MLSIENGLLLVWPKYLYEICEEKNTSFNETICDVEMVTERPMASCGWITSNYERLKMGYHHSTYVDHVRLAQEPLWETW